MSKKPRFKEENCTTTNKTFRLCAVGIEKDNEMYVMINDKAYRLVEVQDETDN